MTRDVTQLQQLPDGLFNGDELVEVTDPQHGKFMLPMSRFVTSTASAGSTAITQTMTLTQAQYDAIATKDPATLYVIVG